MLGVRLQLKPLISAPGLFKFGSIIHLAGNSIKECSEFLLFVPEISFNLLSLAIFIIFLQLHSTTPQQKVQHEHLMLTSR